MSHFLDRLTFFRKNVDTFSDGHGVVDERAARLGGRLPQALAARQNRALHPWRELHRLVLVEDLRQGRHRHLGDPADRLSAHAARPAEPRAARLRAWRQLLLVSVFGQPREAPDGARAPAQTVARGPGDAARRSRPGRRSWRMPGKARELHQQARAGRPGARDLGRGERDHRLRQRLHGQEIRP